MTDEELKQTIEELDENLGAFPESEDSLTREEKRRKQVMLLKKETLKKIQEARAKNNINQEMRHAVNYGLLSSLGDKHPIWMYLLSSKFRSGIF